jgi:hypothetical protein
VTRVYQFAVQDGFEWVLPVNEDDYKIFRKFDGTVRKDLWTPTRVRLLREDEEERHLAESDVPWLGAYAPVFRPRAVATIGGLFTEFGELLPLSCDNADLRVFNVLNVIDALDLKRSDLEFYPNSSRVMRITRYVFISELVKGLTIFKVPKLLSHSVYLTGEVVQAVQAAGLTGVGFRLLWDETAPG